MGQKQRETPKQGGLAEGNAATGTPILENLAVKDFVLFLTW
jgi:hypothetical protein